MEAEANFSNANNEAMDRFSAAAERLFADSGREPYGPEPEWAHRMALRMARSFSPELVAKDCRERPWLFQGYIAANSFSLVKKIQPIDFSLFPREVWLEEIGKFFAGQGVLEVASESDLYDLITEVQRSQCEEELPALRETVLAALDLPMEQARDFFVAFGEGLKRKTAEAALQAQRESNTVKICQFILMNRLQIEDGVFENISELIEFYFYVGDRKGEEPEGNQIEVRKAFASQFRKICSEDGFKLSGRGRPRKADS